MKNSKQFIAFLFLISIFLLIVWLGPQRKEVSKEMLVMGTMCRISIIADKHLGQKPAEDSLVKAFALLKDYERRWNFFSQDSELALINAQAGKTPVKLLPDTFEIINRSLELSRLTDGVFDVTATSLHQQGGYGTIVLDRKDRSIKFNDPSVRIDLGGIATGYAIDRVIEVFKTENINNYLIDIGGDIYASGKNSKNEFWGIGVRDPYAENSMIFEFFLKNQAVTTSGNYVKQHIVDPQTSGISVNNIESVTVIAGSCLEADALATAFFIMGIEKTREFIDRYEQGLQVLFVKKTNDSNPEIVKLNWKNDF